MADPLFWLALSFLLVVVSLTAVLMVAIPAMRELGRAARSAEKFFDTLGRELPPTLEAIRLTGLEITELTDDVTEGVQGAGEVVQRVNQSISTAQTSAQRLNTGTKSIFAGARAAWRAWANESPPRSQTRRQGDGAGPAPGDRSPALERPRPYTEDAFTRLDHGSADVSEQGVERGAGDRPLPGSSQRPQLEETSLKAAPEGLPEAVPEPLPEAFPRLVPRPPQEASRQGNLD
ncbi:MAG TPA: hypothetical protein VEZ50_05490 [Nodosilinea sp.]|nr:hypothetical protein [Nodosilinea sp.]